VSSVRLPVGQTASSMVLRRLAGAQALTGVNFMRGALVQAFCTPPKAEAATDTEDDPFGGFPGYPGDHMEGYAGKNPRAADVYSTVTHQTELRQPDAATGPGDSSTDASAVGTAEHSGSANSQATPATAESASGAFMSDARDKPSVAKAPPADWYRRGAWVDPARITQRMNDDEAPGPASTEPETAVSRSLSAMIRVCCPLSCRTLACGDLLRHHWLQPR
jgi:hypothetical protein